MSEHRAESDKLPPHWEKVHAAIWLIGLAILFYLGDIFPGILILVAISGLAQAGIAAYVKKNQAAAVVAHAREMHLPENCPNCGTPLDAATVRWTGKQSALCPYCGSTIKATAKTPQTAHEAR